jgi:hypothetical protein
MYARLFCSGSKRKDVELMRAKLSVEKVHTSVVLVGRSLPRDN